MTILDTSFLVDSLAGARPAREALRALLDNRERLFLPSIVVYEWARGPRTPEEIAVQRALFPGNRVIPFGEPEAELSARLYHDFNRAGRRARGREIDLAIAATAILRDASLLTLNVADFRDIPGLRLLTLRT